MQKINDIISKKIQSELMYKRALKGGDFGVWEWNAVSNYIYSSQKWYAITEYELSEFDALNLKNPYELINRFVVKEDKEKAINDLNLFMEGITKSYRSEFRIISKSGKIKWVLIKGKCTKKIGEDLILISGSLNDISVRKSLESEVKSLAFYDTLTKLPNRTSFINDLKLLLEKNEKNGSNSALIFIDIDNFRFVNDTFGYNYGDLLLKEFSKLLFDIDYENFSVYRISSDEFILILNNINTKTQVEDVCSKIMENCKIPFEILNEKIYISVSMGVIFFPKDSANINDIFRFADLAMYKSKRNGRDSITFFEESISEHYTRKLMIEQELKSSIEKEELYIVYQPQVDTINKKIIGFEALLRWNNSKLGNVPPSEFIPIAEKSGSIIEIGEWVINSVCEKINELCEKKYDFGHMCINVSPIQLKRSDFAYKLIEILERKNIPIDMIEIEITEGTLIDLHKNNFENINKIIEKGIKIAIDDFGTGYSSLNYLTMIPINTLKIDKSFIDNIDKEKNRAVIECILNLSKVMKYKVIAEGVETEVQMDELINVGGSIIQGYYFSKPIPYSEIEKMLSYNLK